MIVIVMTLLLKIDFIFGMICREGIHVSIFFC